MAIWKSTAGNWTLAALKEAKWQEYQAAGANDMPEALLDRLSAEFEALAIACCLEKLMTEQLMGIEWSAQQEETNNDE